MITEILDRLEQEGTATREELAALLDMKSAVELQELLQRAYRVKLATVGGTVYFRGIVELSNRCAKNCYYCGIRRDNRAVERYTMKEDEVVQAAMWAHAQRYGSIVLQAGERSDGEFTARITRILREIGIRSRGELGITLSLGEQSEQVYREWFEAGAHRYLLRIESSKRDLYRRLHPPDHDFDARLECLAALRRCGYQIGSGVMIGLPGQTVQDLADDLLFLRRIDIDMIGMGPYVRHGDTPLAAQVAQYNAETQLELGLKMIALARLLLRDVNIAATTALQALNPTGRELGLLAGANIVMPNITGTRYRKAYQLYEGKPCLDDDSEMCKGCLAKRVQGIGESIGLGRWGDAPHYEKRVRGAGAARRQGVRPDGPALHDAWHETGNAGR